MAGTVGEGAFAGAIPTIYDRTLVPMFFEPYAEDLASRLGDLESGQVLEIAAGTGAVTRILARRLPARVEIVATDLNRPMLDLAAARLVGRPVTWRQANALSLPFHADAFDAVLCQFGVMFFPDKLRAYREARRVLAPGGRLLFNVWTEIAENEFAHVVTEALAALFPADPPRFLASLPHGYHDRAVIQAALDAAGFERIAIVPVERRSRAESARAAAVGLCQGTPLRHQIEERAPGRLDEVTEAAAVALSKRFGDGVIEGRMGALVVDARRPVA